MQLDKVVKARKSVRRFGKKKPDWRKIVRAIDLARFAPVAGNIFNIKFIVVSDEEKIEKLAETSEQAFVKEVGYVVVVVSNDSRLDAYRDGEKFTRQQSGAAIQNFLLGLVEQGLSTCWVGHFGQARVKRILDVKEGWTVEALFPVGYEGKVKSQKKAKTDLENIMYFDKFGNKNMKPDKKISNEGI